MFPLLVPAAETPPGTEFLWNERSREGMASVFQSQRWKASKTAFIVCDMWDAHHSVNAVRRLKEFAPRLNAVLQEARRRGATIIYAPSDCMPAYAEHPARQRALEAPTAEEVPDGISRWCHRIPEEEAATYPIDQSNGGEDDDLEEHALWAAHLESIGRNPGTPWQRQTNLLEIDDERDFIAAEGEVVWNVLQSRKISHVVLTGVHVNMCVLGRPFGLRQMKRSGKEVLLMRDMTDAVYEPGSWPYVSHFTGLDFVIEHIERHVCPTVTSDQVLGGSPFRFRHDRRSRLAILGAPGAGEDESGVITRDRLHDLRTGLSDAFQVNVTAGVGEDLERADVLLILSGESASPAVAAFETSGRPVVGASAEAASVDPLATHVVEGTREAPLAWIRVRPDGGRSVEVRSRDDLEVIRNSCFRAADRDLPKSGKAWEVSLKAEADWVTVVVPSAFGAKHGSRWAEITWWRCQALVPEAWRGHDLTLDLRCFGAGADVLVNGEAVKGVVLASHVTPGALNTIAVRRKRSGDAEPAEAAGEMVPVLGGPDHQKISLGGRWQVRAGDDSTWSRLPIPPQFGASPDHLFEVSE